MRRFFLREIFLYGFSDALIKSSYFILLPFLLRSISPSEFGELELMLSILALLASFFCFGAGSALQRFCTDPFLSVFERAKYISHSFYIVSFVFICSCLISLFFFLFDFILIDSDFFQYLLVFLLSFLMAVTQVFQDFFRVSSGFFRYLFVAFFSRGFGVILAVFLISLYGVGVDFYYLSLLIGMGVSFVFGLYFLRFYFSYGLDFGVVKNIVFYGWPFALIGPFQWLVSGFDKVLLASIYDFDAVGSYSASAKLPLAFGFLFSSVVAAVGPALLRVRERGEIFLRNLSVLVFIAFCIAFVFLCMFFLFFGDFLIGYFVPVNYSVMSDIVFLLFLGTLLPLLPGGVAVFISISGRTYFYLLIPVVGGVFSSIVSFVLISRMGVEGAALASSFVGIFLFSLYFYFLRICGFFFALNVVPWCLVLYSILIVAYCQIGAGLYWFLIIFSSVFLAYLMYVLKKTLVLIREYEAT